MERMLYILPINNMNWLILFFISLLPLIGLVPNSLPITHDGADHVARIANFFQGLSEGVIIPRWASNLNWGYGHPILMFLYPLSSYIGSFFHTLGFSFVSSVNLVFVVSYIASFFTMYLWMKAAFGKKAGVIGAILYNFAPYRFVDLYVRGAIGEHVAFIFPPLICYFFYKLSHQLGTRNKELFHSLGLTISIACLILSHNAIAIMFLPIIALYALYLFFTETRRSPYFILNTLYFILIGFGLSAFFWIPAFFEGKYTLRDIVTRGEFGNRFVPWTWFFYSPWNYGQGNEFTKSIGIAWIGIIASGIFVWKTKEKSIRTFLITSIILFLVSLFMMTSSTKSIWNNVSLLQKFQFPWRFLSVSVFLSSLIGGITISQCLESKNPALPAGRQQPASKNYEPRTRNLLFISFCIIAVLSTIHMWKPKGYSIKPESFYSGIYESTTDTGESSPIWSIRFMEHRPTAQMEIASGVVTITQGKRTTTVREYTIDAKESSRLVENTLYFPGWKVYVDGIQTGVQYQDPAYRGLITFRVTEGVHAIRIVFEDTKLRWVADNLSLIAVGLLGVTGLVILIWRKKT